MTEEQENAKVGLKQVDSRHKAGEDRNVGQIHTRSKLKNQLEAVRDHKRGRGNQAQ